MIVAIRRDEFSCFLEPHSSGEAYWLSPGAYQYLLGHTDYRVYELMRVSIYPVERMQGLGHLLPLSRAPRIGTFMDEFRPGFFC